MADKSNTIDRLLAAVLIAGGLFGAVLFLYPLGRILAHPDRIALPGGWISLTVVVALLALFAWSTVVGLRLWRREGRGWRWATVLFAMQVPILTICGLHYEYYTGIALQMMGGHVAKHFIFELGSSAGIFLTPGSGNLVYGVNLFAVAAAVRLLMRRAKYGRPAEQVTAAANEATLR